MTLTKKKKLLFVHIPRNAGKSIASALRREYGGKKVMWEHARICDARFNIKPYTTFCVVRNPWERMVSLWRYLILAKKTYEPRKGKCRKVSELEEIGFSSWLINRGKLSNYIVTSDTSQLRWMTKNGKIVMDYVIRYENLIKGFSEVTGLTEKHLPLQHKTTHDEYQKYYTPESREFIERVFAKDIKKWGYRFG